MAEPARTAGTAADSRARSKAPARGRRRLATIGAAAGLAMVFTALSHQYAKTYTLAREEARLEQRRHELIADNARLREEIERLQTDDHYIEDIARRQLGLVRPGEIELFVVPYSGTPAPAGGDLRPRPAAWQKPVPERAAQDVAPPLHRGIGRWALAVRNAVRRLFRLAAPR
jgi:cell division protein FtsB